MRANLDELRFKLRNRRGKLQDIELEDGMYVMIINKWPYPISFEISGRPNPNPPPPDVLPEGTTITIPWDVLNDLNADEDGEDVREKFEAVSSIYSESE